MKTGTLLIGLSFLISKILGIVRDNLLASTFGAATDLDMYYAAFRLPDFLFNLLSYGVLSAAFVPLFMQYLKKDGRESAFSFTSEVLSTLSLIMLGVTGVLFVLTPQIMSFIVPGFAASELRETVMLTRIMLATPILFTISSVFSGVQNSLHTFAGMALAPVMYNVGIIGGIIFGARFGIYGAAIGVVCGAALNMLVQIPSMVKSGFKFSPPKSLWSTRIGSMLSLSLPRIFGMSVTQVSLVISTIIASSLPVGSIAIINFSTNLQSLPLGLIGITISIVSFGVLSGFAAEEKTDEFVQELSVSLRKILFLLVPITLGMFLLRFQIVRLLLGRGEFDWTDTILTANTLGILLIGLSFGGVIFTLARAFYAQKDTKTPVFIGLFAVAINISLSVILTKFYSMNTYGLALAVAIADILNASLLVIYLTKKLKRSILDSSEIFKFVLATLAMSLTVQFVKDSFGNIFADINTYAELMAQTITTILAGAATYFIFVWILKAKDMMIFVKKKQKVIS